jgi:hypothetical protein
VILFRLMTEDSSKSFDQRSDSSRFVRVGGGMLYVRLDSRTIYLFPPSAFHVIQAVLLNQWYCFWAVHRPRSRCVRFLYLSSGLKEDT